MTDIVCNTIFEWRDPELKILCVERILWVSPNTDDVVVIDIRGTKSWPTVRSIVEFQAALRDGTGKRLSLDPFARFSNPPEEYVTKHSAIRDKAWEVIRSIVCEEPSIYDPSHRGRLVRHVCEEFGVHRKVVHDYLRRYWVRGKMPNALLPEYYNSGAPGKERVHTEGPKRGRPPKTSRADSSLVGINVTEQDRKKIRAAIKEYYLTPQRPQLTWVYEQMKLNYYNRSVTMIDGKPVPIMAENHEMITFYQFRYWAEKELSEIHNSLEKRVGKRRYNLSMRPLLGNATQRAFGPGSVYEIDATIADVYLVNSLDRNRVIGRPVVYTLKDVFSRLVVGVYVGLEGPSWLGAMMALENATCDKVAFCEEFGISISEEDWPCHYLPQTITADRGEMEGTNADNLALSLGIRIDNMPPYRADLKGIIEKHFDIYKGKVGPFVPGLVEKEIRERGEPDYRLRSRMTLDGFTRILIYSVLEHNKEELSHYPLSLEMTNDHVPPIPLELWNWGIVNCSGQLHERPRDVIRLNLMPRVNASVTRQGIEVNHKEYGILRYSGPEIVRMGWYERALKGRFRVKAAFDLRYAKAIYIPGDDGASYIRCDLLDQFERFQGCRVEEVMDQFYYEKVASQRRKSSQNQNSAIYATLRKQIIDEETKLTEAALDPSQSAQSRTRDIRTARRAERETTREREAWELGTSTNRHPAGITEIEEESHEDTNGAVNGTLMDMLKRQALKRRDTYHE